MNRISLSARVTRFLILAILIVFVSGTSSAGTKKRHHRPVKRHSKSARKALAKAAVRVAPATAAGPLVRNVVATRSYRATTPVPIIRGGPWTAPTYADSTLGDNVDGEDLEVRRAAVEALGPYNGSVVVVDSGTGRILSMV